jgi:hypothetical protein
MGMEIQEYKNMKILEYENMKKPKAYEWLESENSFTTRIIN